MLAMRAIPSSPMLVLSGLAVLSSGCAEWPRHGNLPAEETLVPATDDPSALVKMSWTPIEETADDNDLLAGAQQGSLGPGAGYLVTGALDSSGWSDGAVAEPIADESCGSEGTRSPLDAGDYIGDVDFYIVEITADATACAEIQADSDGYGWDLLLFELDACDVPVQAIKDEDGLPVGLDGGGQTGGWGVVVPAGRYAVLLASYDHPDDVERDVPLGYRLGLSTVPEGPEGTTGTCPMLPEASR